LSDTYFVILVCFSPKTFPVSDDEICRLKQGHGNTLMKVEDSIKGNQQELSRKDTEIRDLKVSLPALLVMII
jgi:hypothetical protein